MIRPARPADATACAAIYAPYVTDSIISFEETPPTPSQIRQRMDAAHMWLVAEDEGEVRGYAYGSAHRDRHAYRWAADVAIYLAGEHRGRGLGRALYSQLFNGLRERGLCVLCAGVALPNAASVALHHAMGFTEVGTYRRIAFKCNRWIDTRWYQLDLRPAQAVPPALAASGNRRSDLQAELDHILAHGESAGTAARAVDAIRERTGWRWVGIYTVADGLVRNDAWSGPAAPAHPSFPAAHGLTAAAIESRRTVYCPDVSADQRYLTNQPTTGSELIVPVLRDGAVVGTLDVESDCPDAFGETERRLAEDLAERLAALWQPRT
jgi:L-amino acid N-acyltransferase YncA/putative methionine-R-sulfoxide reductase with GAF domain